MAQGLRVQGRIAESGLVSALSSTVEIPGIRFRGMLLVWVVVRLTDGRKGERRQIGRRIIAFASLAISVICTAFRENHQDLISAQVIIGEFRIGF